MPDRMRSRAPFGGAAAGRVARLCGLFLVLALALHGKIVAAAAPPQPKRVAIDLLTAASSVPPGATVWIALRERIEPGWHTYWSNPGDSGEPTTITWKLPPGFEAGPLQYPVPHPIPVGPLMNYGFSGEALLLSRLAIPRDAVPGAAEITAQVEWLVCKDICIPESGEVRLKLQIAPAGASPSPSPDAAAIEAALAALPKPSPWPAAFASDAETMTLTFAGAGDAQPRSSKVTFFADTWGVMDHAATQEVSWSGKDLTIKLRRGDLKKSQIAGLSGLLVLEGVGRTSDSRESFTVVAGSPPAAPAQAGQSAVVRDAPSPAAVTKPATATGAREGGETGLLKALLFAFLGGLILNLMPCVFPVLSLKAVAIARHDAQERKSDGLAYLAGVMTSFAVLAIGLLALRHAGQTFGWGFQFQSPGFVLLMAGLFFVLGLSLSGLLSFGATLTGAGETLTQKDGSAGTFFTGALATIAATPCTAPFMGAAVGFALSASAVSGFVVLMAMGLGFAAPMVALAMAPGLQRLLPRPGRWMESFKQVMAFPLYASAAWMVWVLSVQTGSDGVLAAMTLLVGLGFLAWLWSRTQEAGGAVWSWVVAASAVALTLLAVSQLPAADRTRVADAGASSDATGLPIVPFSEERIASLQSDGRPVFVNLTAAWCITCKVNERVALASPRIRDAFSSGKIAYVKGDWTRQDPAITRFLQAHGRAGVPLYLIYPGKAGAAPRVLDQILTEGMVLAELRAAGAVR